METPIERACKAAGTATELAKELCVTIQTVSNWKARKSVPPEYCLKIEQATGGAVTRYELRPDVFGSSPERAAA